VSSNLTPSASTHKYIISFNTTCSQAIPTPFPIPRSVTLAGGQPERRARVAVMVCLLLVATFGAWHEEKGRYEHSEIQRISSQHWLQVWSDRAKHTPIASPNSEHRMVVPQPLKRLLAYDNGVQFDQRLTETGMLVRHISFNFKNAGTDPLQIDFLGGSLSIDANAAMKCVPQKFRYVSAGQTETVDCNSIEDSALITDANDKLKLKYELHYDTIPSTGIRRSERLLEAKVAHATATHSVGSEAFELTSDIEK
jgi:hypothetical protein